MACKKHSINRWRRIITNAISTVVGETNPLIGLMEHKAAFGKFLDGLAGSWLLLAHASCDLAQGNLVTTALCRAQMTFK